MQIVSDIRESVNDHIKDGVFNYGRATDTALASANLEVVSWFVHLDPVQIDGEVNLNERARVDIGFLQQDKPDSSFDAVDSNLDIDASIEQIQSDAKDLSLQWLNYFLDNYKYSCTTYTIRDVTRIKNVMSGVLLSVTFLYKPKC